MKKIEHIVVKDGLNKMTRVNLVKYGFVRWPEEDFSDDGNRFTCYRVGKKIRVSKLISDGMIFLSADSNIGNNTLPYEVYSKLPSYHKASWEYNGVSLSSLTEEALQEFYEACLAYEKEYEDAEANIQYPSLQEIKEQAELIQTIRHQELVELSKLIGIHAIKLTEKLAKYEWINLYEYLNHIRQAACQVNPETYPQTIYKTSSSFAFVSPNNSALKPSYWYEQAMNYFERVTINS